jgi:hypothetical protein
MSVLCSLCIRLEVQSVYELQIMILGQFDLNI